MKKILLTSAGFDNKNISQKFLELLDKNIEEVQVLFITTAAIEVDAVRILPACLDDLTNCGIKEENIKIYDMHKCLSQKEINQYDAIYVCGGKTEYLVERIKEISFKKILDNYLEQGGIYIGVSAGSVACSGNYPEGLKLIKNKISVHCETGTENGIIASMDDVCLTDDQAILITEEENRVIA